MLPKLIAKKAETYTRVWEDMAVVDSITKNLNDEDLLDTLFDQAKSYDIQKLNPLINSYFKTGKLSYENRQKIYGMIKLLYCDYFKG
jgi:hypothetical protein